MVTRNQLILVLTVTALYLIGQLLTGTAVAVASLLSVAILFGTLSIFAGGGLASAFGCLNAILIGKFLLVGVAIKIALLEPADTSLNAPRTTALVMALGFIGIFVGTLVQAHLPCPHRLSINRALSDRVLLSLSIVVFAVGYAGYFAGLIPSARGEGVQTGGWLGIARSLGSLMSFSIVPPMLYLWRIRSRLWMTHPAVLGLLAWSSLVGIFSTAKQDAMEPLVFYMLVGFLRYGWRDLRLWSLVSVGLMYYAVIVFPYSQYVRFNGGRQGTLEQRAHVTKDTFMRIASDQSFRATVADRASQGSSYLGPGLSSFSRLAMIGEADRLIAATEGQRSFTGWETITWGFKLATPSFVYPNKPIVEAGNYLAHIVGEVHSSDTETQVSYGIMANLYNAFSLSGVLIGTPIFFAGFYYWVRIFLGDARWESMPTASTLWFLWLIASYQHSIVESSVAGLIASLLFPIVLGFVYMLSQGLSLFVPHEFHQA
jgi:hypothetical protein